MTTYNYLLSVEATYAPGDGQPETLASAIQSALFDVDYSIQLRAHGSEYDDTRCYVGIFSIDWEEPGAARSSLVAAVEETGPERWSLVV